MIDNLDDVLNYYKESVRMERKARGSETEREWRIVRYTIFKTLNLLGFGDAALAARSEIEEER